MRTFAAASRRIWCASGIEFARRWAFPRGARPVERAEHAVQRRIADAKTPHIPWRIKQARAPIARGAHSKS
jgi:hypothetical protein